MAAVEAVHNFKQGEMMIKIVSKNNGESVMVTDEQGNMIKNITSLDLQVDAGKVPIATLRVFNPIVEVAAFGKYEIVDLSLYPTRYLVELQNALFSELEKRKMEKVRRKDEND